MTVWESRDSNSEKVTRSVLIMNMHERGNVTFMRIMILGHLIIIRPKVMESVLGQIQTNKSWVKGSLTKGEHFEL